MHLIRWLVDPKCTQCSGKGFYSHQVAYTDYEDIRIRVVCDCVSLEGDPHAQMADIAERMRTLMAALHMSRKSRASLEYIAIELENRAAEKLIPT